jgi:hypothetical protein
MNKLTLTRFNAVVYRVETAQGEHVGNLKLINGCWKFKAVGYDPKGDILPGGGPLTHQHNMSFDVLDEATISERLSAD